MRLKRKRSSTFMGRVFSPAMAPTGNSNSTSTAIRFMGIPLLWKDYKACFQFAERSGGCKGEAGKVGSRGRRGCRGHAPAPARIHLGQAGQRQAERDGHTQRQIQRLP